MVELAEKYGPHKKLLKGNKGNDSKEDLAAMLGASGGGLFNEIFNPENDKK